MRVSPAALAAAALACVVDGQTFYSNVNGAVQVATGVSWTANFTMSTPGYVDTLNVYTALDAGLVASISTVASTMTRGVSYTLSTKQRPSKTPGWVRFDLPSAAPTTLADTVVLSLSLATPFAAGAVAPGIVACNFTTIDQVLTVLSNDPGAGNGLVQQGNGWWASPNFTAPFEAVVVAVAPQASDWPGTGSSFTANLYAANATAINQQWSQTVYPDGQIAVRNRPFGVPLGYQNVLPQGTPLLMTVGNPQGAPWPGCGSSCLTCGVTQDPNFGAIHAVATFSLAPTAWKAQTFNSSTGAGAPSLGSAIGYTSQPITVPSAGFIHAVEMQTDPSPGSSGYCSVRMTVTTPVPGAPGGSVAVMTEAPFARDGYGPFQPLSVPFPVPVAVPAGSTVGVYHTCLGNSYAAVVYGSEASAGVAFQVLSAVGGQQEPEGHEGQGGRGDSER